MRFVLINYQNCPVKYCRTYYESLLLVLRTSFPQREAPFCIFPQRGKKREKKEMDFCLRRNDNNKNAGMTEIERADTQVCPNRMKDEGNDR